MKFKKFLIIILSVALLSCFAVSTFATDATTVSTIPDYGFYISPGDYVFKNELSAAVTDYAFSLRFSSNSLNYYGLRISSDNVLVYFLVPNFIDNYTIVYSFNGGWTSDDYRYFTVLDGFYIYDINAYQWWQSNVTRVDSGYDNNLLDGILSSFTFIGEWIAGAANAVTPMFWDGEALTVVGTLSVAGLSFAVVFLLIALVSSFMKFRS